MPRINARTSDNDTNMAINNVAGVVDELLRRCPLLDGLLLEGVKLTVGQNVAVPHGLRRPYRGFFVTRVYPDAVIASPGIVIESSIRRMATHLELRAEDWAPSEITISLWVY
jgi:hypothetical protein